MSKAFDTKAGELAIEAFATGFKEGLWRGKLEAVDDLYKALGPMRLTDKRRHGLKWAIKHLGKMAHQPERPQTGGGDDQ